MNFRRKITLSLLLTIVLGGAAFAQVVDIPDPNLRTAIADALNIAHDAPITRQDMRRLVDLVAVKSGITDLTGLEHATHMTGLSLWENPLANLTPLANLERLEYLDIALCSISDIAALSNLVSLITLNARHNLIVDISPIANLTNLITLRLDNNRITDVRPLANLTNLEFLEIQRNHIADHSFLDNLSLNHFLYDQHCEIPPLPLHDRIHDRTYPSIVARWSDFGWLPFGNLPELSDTENLALNDLWFSGPRFGLRFIETADGFAMAGILDEAIPIHDELLSTNPNMILLVSIPMREYAPDYLPEDWPYWVRDENGDIATGWAGSYLVDFTHPEVQERLVQQAIAVSKCGLFDGIFFDVWTEDVTQNGYLDHAAELRARENILQRIRAETRSDFLIMGNTNDRIVPRTGSYLNGGFMETSMPRDKVGDILETKLSRVENSLLWLEQNLRQPTINALEGWSIPTEPPDSPTNLRWMRAVTTLSLTHSDGYVVYLRGDDGYWHDFWDADLGRPVDPRVQLYKEIPGLYIREFTNGWAVYNHSGVSRKITFPEETISVASDLTNTLHALPNIDGGIYLKKTLSLEVPDGSDSDVYVDTPDLNGNEISIAEPIDALPGAALHFDASNNPGTIARWVNLGTAGGTLLAADAPPRLEEGEIEIPSIGFSGLRRYYTATAPRQTFGGPVRTNPKLYLGDWTLEFLCKRNGNLFAEEHQFAGFQNSPREGLQGIRLRLLSDGRELGISIHADGFKQPERTLNVFLDENVWTWVTIVSTNGESIVTYQNGVEVSRHRGVYFDESLPLDDISIGSNSYDEQRRNFNGSFSIVRVYDKALNPDEVLQNIGATVIPYTNPADVNGDGVVNILDLVLVAQGISGGDGEGDVNGDGVVNVFDLVQVAGAIGGGGAAPSAYPPDLSIISAADVERWLAQTQGLGVGDANFQRGIRFLEGSLAALTPNETTLLPNFPNPFNPETWIPYRLAREAEVAITIYDTKGRQVRRLALGNQPAGYYAERGKAAYWDGRNERGEVVASGIYIYQFRAGDYAASRRMVIVK